MLERIKILKLESLLLFLAFTLLLVYFILQPPIYSPDTHSYLKGDIYRYPGYVGFLNGFNYIFGDLYDVFVVGFQLVFGFVGITVVFKNCSAFFNLKTILKLLLLTILIIPYFPPLSIANNLTSEGVAYPLYLILTSIIIDFLFRNKRKKIFPLAIVFIILGLTRGQFITLIPIIGFIYAFKLKKKIFQLRNLSILIIIIGLPILSGLLDSSYRKLTYGFFEQTPFSYVNAISLPLYVSEKNNSELMRTQAHKTIFNISYRKIDDLNLLNSKIEGTYMEKYQVFHDNFPIISNQNIHKQGRAYFRKHDKTPFKDYILIEQASKEMFPILLMANIKDWSYLYITGIIYGFGYWWVLSLVLVVFILSSYSLMKKYTVENAFLLFATSTLISNSMVTALATHSIQRYLFYNYFLGFIVVFLVAQKIYRIYESRIIGSNALPK